MHQTKCSTKILKSKLISSQNDYKHLLEKFETFENLNCELTTKIEQLELKALNSEHLKELLASLKMLLKTC
jgi:hypothetical protein